MLRSDPGDAWRGVILATNPELRRHPGDKAADLAGDAVLARRTLSIVRERTLADRFREQIGVANHTPTPQDIRVELALDVDSADIFEVRGYDRAARGELLPIQVTADGLVFGYRGLDEVTLRTHVTFDPAPEITAAPEADLGSVIARWAWHLEPGEKRRLEWRAWSERDPTDRPLHTIGTDVGATDPAAAHREWTARNATIETDNDIVDRVVARGVDDLCLLLDRTSDGDDFVAAGVPWFATLFGRDSLLASFGAIAFAPSLAADTLRVLARRQATAVSDEHDAEPGKILHELRSGEMARTGELPFAGYYGSVDSTPLWLVLLGEYHDWTADDDLVEELWPSAMAALEWLDTWGDLDGDGLVEYARRSPRGLRNQGWKDSADAIRDRTGRIAEPPIALAEVQGYAYDARRRMARLARRRGEDGLAARLDADAALLKARFAERFWVADRSYLAMALDCEKRPMDALGSNAGHCLWSGIVPDEAAHLVAERLLAPDLFSGWGIRTYGADDPGYNPLGYHTGSVWPHDTAIAAAGLKRVGEDEAARRLADGLFDAAQEFPGFRLPELLCGFERSETGGPVPYPVACSPQAWAAAVPLWLIRTSLGLRADAAAGELELIRPMLPSGIDKLVIRRLRVGPSTCDVLVHRWRGRTSAEVLHKDDALRVTIRL